MSGKTSTRVNLNGLIFYVDASNSNSYTVTNLIDLIGFRTGTITGTTYNSLNGGNLSFNGTTDYIYYPFDDIFKVSYTTIDCWINPTSVGNMATLFSTFDFSDYDIGQTPTGFALTWGNNTFSFYYADGGTAGALKTSASTSIIGKWTNIVLVYDGTTTKFYLNGNLLTSVSASGPINWTYSPPIVTHATIGRKSINVLSIPGYFPGKIASVKVYNRALSASELIENYNKFYTRFN